jgi:hypothetical protein
MDARGAKETTAPGCSVEESVRNRGESATPRGLEMVKTRSVQRAPPGPKFAPRAMMTVPENTLQKLAVPPWVSYGRRSQTRPLADMSDLGDELFISLDFSIADDP